MVDLRVHGPVVIAQPPELGTNKPSEISPNLIKIDNYDEMMTLNVELVTRDNRSQHSDITIRHEIVMSVT